MGNLETDSLPGVQPCQDRVRTLLRQGRRLPFASLGRSGELVICPSVLGLPCDKTLELQRQEGRQEAVQVAEAVRSALTPVAAGEIVLDYGRLRVTENAPKAEDPQEEKQRRKTARDLRQKLGLRPKFWLLYERLEPSIDKELTRLGLSL